MRCNTYYEKNQLANVNQELSNNSKITIYFNNNMKWSIVNAYLYKQENLRHENYDKKNINSKTSWPGEALNLLETNKEGIDIYSYEVDLSVYSHIVFNNGKDKTVKIPLSAGSSGYFIRGGVNTAYCVGLYTYGQFEKGTITTAILPYSKTKGKKITIWTPPSYNVKDKDNKYGVLYMTDGQNLFGNDPKCSPIDWGVDDAILSIIKNGQKGLIVVGIDNSDDNRNAELTPNIGEVISSYADDFAFRTGEEYAKFVVNTVLPYIEDNYNVYTDNSHRGIAGSSSGGLEAFYIGMKYPDNFDYIGALSPALLLFHEDTWNRYLNKFDFSNEAKLPRIYIYNGNGDSLEKELYPNAVAMEGWLKNIGYPSDRIKTAILDSASHNETYWQIVFPEILCWCLKYLYNIIHITS